MTIGLTSGKAVSTTLYELTPAAIASSIKPRSSRSTNMTIGRGLSAFARRRSSSASRSGRAMSTMITSGAASATASSRLPPAGTRNTTASEISRRRSSRMAARSASESASSTFSVPDKPDRPAPRCAAHTANAVPDRRAVLPCRDTKHHIAIAMDTILPGRHSAQRALGRVFGAADGSDDRDRAAPRRSRPLAVARQHSAAVEHRARIARPAIRRGWLERGPGATGSGAARISWPCRGPRHSTRGRRIAAGL